MSNIGMSKIAWFDGFSTAKNVDEVEQNLIRWIKTHNSGEAWIMLVDEQTLNKFAKDVKSARKYGQGLGEVYLGDNKTWELDTMAITIQWREAGGGKCVIRRMNTRKEFYNAPAHWRGSNICFAF